MQLACVLTGFGNGHKAANIVLRARLLCALLVQEKASAGIPAVLTLAGVLTATAWWRKEGRKVQGRDWKSLPGKKTPHLLSNPLSYGR